jgi:hypothetical protein
MKFATGMVVGIALSLGASGLLAQRDFHPRLTHAVEALKDARAYLQEAPHDFGGHKADAIRATDNAIRQIELARAYHPR